jgi:Protein of unknown function (DUF3006)
MPRESHRWVIDSIAEHIATIEVDGAAPARVPEWVLPRGAAEGDVLRVEHDVDASGRRSVLTIEIDRDATAAALDASRAQVDAIRTTSTRRDRRGDVKF